MLGWGGGGEKGGTEKIRGQWERRPEEKRRGRGGEGILLFLHSTCNEKQITHHSVLKTTSQMGHFSPFHLVVGDLTQMLLYVKSQNH